MAIFPRISSTDWRLVAINLWAYVANIVWIDDKSAKVYDYILSQWWHETDWAPLERVDDPRHIVLSAEKFDLSAAARGTLLQIAQSTSEANAIRMDTEIIRTILHGVPLNEMVAAHPTIADSVTDIICSWVVYKQKNRLDCTRGSSEVSEAYEQLPAVLRPSTRTSAASGHDTTGSTWSIISPYLSAASEWRLIGIILMGAATILSSRADIIGDTERLFEELLDRGVARKLVLSYEDRGGVPPNSSKSRAGRFASAPGPRRRSVDLRSPPIRGRAFFVARHAHTFATNWWTEMRSELEAYESSWTATKEFEDAATFVRKVEEAGACLACARMSYLRLLHLEDEQYVDAWVEHTLKDAETRELSMSHSEDLM